MADTPTSCTRCGGKGVLPVEGDDMTVQQCICSYSRVLKQHLGAEIATAEVITKSPLFLAGTPGEPPKLDRTKENLFLKGYWRDLLPHLKWSLGCKGPLFRFRMLTDERLKAVYLGSESYAARPKGRRDDVVTFNTLSDVVGPDNDLLIIRLGFLGYKNVAMPGILKEALMIREFACKPTWLVEVPTSPFGAGHFTYSEEVGDYVAKNFQIVNLTRKESAHMDETPHGIAGVAHDEPDIGLGVNTPNPVPEPTVQGTVSRFSAPVIDLPGEDRPYKPKQQRSSFKKRRTESDGPV